MKKVYALIAIIIFCISCSTPLSEEKTQFAVVDTPITTPSYIPSTPIFTPTLQLSSTSTATPMATSSPTPTLTPSITPTQTSEIISSQSHHLLAFLLFKNNWPNGDIWTVEEDGTSLKQITNIGYIYGYVWSPDGENIAFVHYENGNAEIYFIDADGSDLHQITNGADPYLGMIDWSESKIAFLRDLGTYGKWGEEAKISYIELGEPGYPIFDISPVIQIPGTEWTVRQYNGLNWSPNGQWIVLHMPGEGGIASSDGSIFINENFGNARWKNDSTLVIMPSLSGIEYFNPNNNDSGYIEPVGGYVAVFSPNDQYIIYCNDDAIMRMKSDGTENTVIAQGKGADPVWNTIGNKLAYISWEFADGGFDRSTGIRIINADGSEQIQVVTGFALSPRWQP